MRYSLTFENFLDPKKRDQVWNEIHKEEAKAQPSFTGKSAPFHFPGSITFVSPSLVMEACLFAEYASISFQDSLGEFWSPHREKLPSKERSLYFESVSNYNPINLLSFVQFIEACVLFDHVILFLGTDPYDILGHNLVYNGHFDLSQSLIDEKVLYLVGDYNKHQLQDSNIPLNPFWNSELKTLNEQLGNAYNSSKLTVIPVAGKTMETLDGNDFEWNYYSAFCTIMTMNLYAVPITLSPRWSNEARFLLKIHDKSQSCLIRPLITALNEVIDCRIDNINYFLRAIGTTTRLNIPPIAGVILNEVAKGENLFTALMNIRKKFSKLRKRFYERQQILENENSSFHDIEKVYKALLSDIQNLKTKFSINSQNESWITEEWRALPDAIKDLTVVATSIDNPAKLTNMVVEKVYKNVEEIKHWFKFRHLRQLTRIGHNFLKNNQYQNGLAALTGKKIGIDNIHKLNRAISLLSNTNLGGCQAFVQLQGPDRCSPFIYYDSDKLGQDDLKWLRNIKNNWS